LIARCSPFYSDSAVISQKSLAKSVGKLRQVGIKKYLTIGRNHFAKPCFSLQ